MRCCSLSKPRQPTGNEPGYRDSRGSFLTELVIVLPLLYMLFLSVIDISMGMLTYVRVSRVAYEAARYGASLPGLPSTFDSTKSICEHPTPSDPQTQQIVGRASKIMKDTKLYFATESDVHYAVAYDSTSRQVFVCLTVPWNGMFPGLTQMLGGGGRPAAVRTVASAPYLFVS